MLNKIMTIVNLAKQLNLNFEKIVTFEHTKTECAVLCLLFTLQKA